MATCKTNKKSYIGKTKHSLSHRRKQHYSAASYGSNAFFHRAIRKYGKDSFEWRVLFSSQKEEELLQKEKDMAARVLGIKNGGGISACCCGTQKTAYGYHWQYA